MQYFCGISDKKWSKEGGLHYIILHSVKPVLNVKTTICTLLLLRISLKRKRGKEYIYLVSTNTHTIHKAERKLFYFGNMKETLQT